jgi:hypothetical protein
MAFSAKRNEEPIRRLFSHRALEHRVTLVEPQMRRIAWGSTSAAEAGEQLYPFSMIVLTARIRLAGVRREVLGDARGSAHAGYFRMTVSSDSNE